MKKMKKFIVIGFCLALFMSASLSVSAASVKDLFDAKYYADSYADLKAAFGYDEEALYEHYLVYGMKEGRSASAYFDVQKYRQMYSDLENAFGDDWQKYTEHYLIYGLSEARDGGGEFDAVSYANRYQDLYDAFGYDLVSLAEHYETYGKSENRIAESQVVVEQREAEEAARKQEIKDQESSGSSSELPDEEYDEHGYRYIYTYDDAGNVIHIEVYDSEGSFVAASDLTYTSEGVLIKEDCTYADGSSESYVYDESGKLLKWFLNGVLRQEFRYTADGKFEYFYDLRGVHYSTFEYVGDKRVKGTVYDEAGNVTGDISFDENGLQLRDVRYRADGTVEFETFYNAGVRAKWIAYREDGTIKNLSYYNESGKPAKSETYAADGTTLFGMTLYNEEGKPSKGFAYYMSGKVRTEYFYNPDGTLASQVDYDEDGNIKEN